MDIQEIVKKSKHIACDEIPAIGGRNADTILSIFKANKGKYFSAKILKEFFKENNIEIKGISNNLSLLRKDNKLISDRTGWYRLA